MNRTVRSSLLALLFAIPLFGQQGNELVFVGTSMSGAADPYFLVAADTGALVETGIRSETDNARGAVWADQGGNLYVPRAPGVTPGGSGPSISRASWNGAATTWSTLHPTPGLCYGLGLDAVRQRLWVLTGPAASSRELRCVDADPNSPGYGTMLAQTSVLTGAPRERWQLSPSGNYAAVAHTFLSVQGCLDLIDLDPASPTYLQKVAAVIAGGGTSIACAVSGNDQYAFLLCSPTALVVVHIPTATVLDFDPATPGQQNFVVPLGTPTSMVLATDGAFAVLSGLGSGGWAGRIDFDYTTPSNTTFTRYSAAALPSCYGVSLSPDETRVALTTTSTGGCTLRILEVATGNLVHSTALPTATGVTFTAWQSGSQFATYSSFGSGCPGSLGTPTLAAVPGATPVLGSTFALAIDPMPQGLAMVAFGLSATTVNGLPLPLELGVLGMPNCSLLVAPDAAVLVVGAGSNGIWTWTVPAAPVHFGLRFYNQAFVVDAAANAAGIVVSNAGAGQVGF